jgi:hypothetical protein
MEIWQSGAFSNAKPMPHHGLKQGGVFANCCANLAISLPVETTVHPSAQEHHHHETIPSRTIKEKDR